MKSGRIVFLVFLALFLSVTLVFAGGNKDTGKKGGYVIGFSNSFNGNTYRQAMEGHARDAAEKLKATGELKELIFAEANQNNSVQIQQIQSFIMQKVDAIIIDPGSATALTGVIQEASDAGIPVIIINDGPVESNAALCYQINFDAVEQMSFLAEWVLKEINYKGNVIELRGAMGDSFDAVAHQGFRKVLDKHPDVTVVAEIYTDWTGSKAQAELSSVLPTLPKIDAILNQGGDSYAAVQAFKAAGRPLPVIGGDNRGFFLKWWANEAPDYNSISVSSNPWDGATAVYAAVEILNGARPKNVMIHPFGVVTKDEVQQFRNVPDEAIACPTFDREWVKNNILNQK
jgi:ribose transport system substrate-binding protein